MKLRLDLCIKFNSSETNFFIIVITYNIQNMYKIRMLIKKLAIVESRIDRK